MSVTNFMRRRKGCGSDDSFRIEIRPFPRIECDLDAQNIRSSVLEAESLPVTICVVTVIETVSTESNRWRYHNAYDVMSKVAFSPTFMVVTPSSQPVIGSQRPIQHNSVTHLYP